MKTRIHKLAQSGFTLIELIIVIVIIGVLAAVAIPRFTNISSQAAQASTDGIAGGLASAGATNFALRSGINTLGSAVANCTDAGGLLQGGLPANYVITGGTIGNAVTVACTLTHTPSTSVATFQLTGIP